MQTESIIPDHFQDLRMGEVLIVFGINIVKNILVGVRIDMEVIREEVGQCKVFFALELSQMELPFD